MADSLTRRRFVHGVAAAAAWASPVPAFAQVSEGASAALAGAATAWLSTALRTRRNLLALRDVDELGHPLTRAVVGGACFFLKGLAPLAFPQIALWLPRLAR